MNATATDRWSKFIRDVGIYSVGNIGAKIITFLMVPLYTYFLPDTAQFGYFDICLTAAFLLSPIITLNVHFGAFRFLLNAPSEDDRKCVVTAMSQLLARSLALTVVIMLSVACFAQIEHVWLVMALLLTVAISDVYGQLVRGLGNNRLFVIIGIATAFLVALLSVVFVACLKMGIAGVFLANILARLIPILVVELWRRPLSGHFAIASQWRSYLKELLHYSLPLIPTLIIWWVLSFGDRWFVLWAVGAKANGIYAVAARFTGIIYTVAVIVQQAWQETAIMQYNSDDRDHFFSQIFSIFVFVLCSVTIIYVAALKLTYGWIVSSHYTTSEQYIFPMAVAACIYSVANFLEMGYQCSLQTHRTLIPSIVTCVVNVVLNIILAPIWGCWGVIVASTLSFVFFAVYRWIDTRRYFILRPSKMIIEPITALVVFGVIVYLPLQQWLSSLFTVLILFRLAAIAVVHHKYLECSGISKTS